MREGSVSFLAQHIKSCDPIFVLPSICVHIDWPLRWLKMREGERARERESRGKADSASRRRTKRSRRPALAFALLAVQPLCLILTAAPLPVQLDKRSRRHSSVLDTSAHG
jgi:hypothetical protein